MSLAHERQMSNSIERPNRALSSSMFKPTEQRTRKKAVTQLTLTSLVDCFTILVIYLLVSTHIGGEEIQMPENIQLPLAQTTDSYNHGTSIAYANGKYIIAEKTVSLGDLVSALEAAKIEDKDYLNILADKKTDFEDLNAAVLAGLQAGFKQIRFVVKQGDEA